MEPNYDLLKSPKVAEVYNRLPEDQQRMFLEDVTQAHADYEASLLRVRADIERKIQDGLPGWVATLPHPYMWKAGL